MGMAHVCKRSPGLARQYAVTDLTNNEQSLLAVD